VSDTTMYPGPEIDGRPSWFVKGSGLPGGWERQVLNVGTRGIWRQAGEGGRPSPSSWYLARPIVEPDPPALRDGWQTTGEDGIVITWGDMKNRADLDQWETLSIVGTREGGPRWVDLRNIMQGTPESYPVRVRRKAEPVTVDPATIVSPPGKRPWAVQFSEVVRAVQGGNPPDGYVGVPEAADRVWKLLTEDPQ